MKYFLSFVLIFLALSSYAQEPAYTPMNSNYKFRGIRVDSLFLIPSFADTNAANTQRCKNIPGSMIRTGNDFWMRNATATAWLQNVNIGTGASPVLSFINEVFKKAGTDSIFYIIAPHDTTFAYKDSSGGGGGGGSDSPDRINGEASNNVTSDFRNYVWYVIRAGIKVNSNKDVGFNDVTKNAVFEIRNYDSTIIINSKLYFTDTAAGNIGTISAMEGLTIRTNVLTFADVNEVTMSDGKMFADVAKINNCSSIDTLFIPKPGLYKVDSVNIVPTLISFPNPSNFPGASIYLINSDLNDYVDFSAPKPQLADGSDVSPQGKRTSYQYVSDGTSWKLLFN